MTQSPSMGDAMLPSNLNRNFSRVHWLVGLPRSNILLTWQQRHPLTGCWSAARPPPCTEVCLQPGDVDLLTHTAADVCELSAVLPPAEAVAAQLEIDPRTFLSSQTQPVIIFGEGAWTFGRWLLMVRC